MTTYTITTSNYNDPAFWSAISQSSGGHTLDFFYLPSSYSTSFNPDTGTLSFWNGSSWYTIGESGNGSTDANLGSPTQFSYFDVIYGGEGADEIKGTSGDDFLAGDYGADVIDGGDGDDTIQGNWDNDTLSGGSGSDVFQLSDYAGDDIVDGGETGSDQDTIQFFSTQNLTVTYTGDESGSYSNSSSATSGSFSNIEGLALGSGNDTLSASATSSGVTVDSGAGDDSITGGTGDDSITGGTGDDRFVLSTTGGRDTITDFDASDSNGDGFFNDQIDTGDLVGGSGAGGLVTIADVVVTDDGSGNAVLTFPGGEQLVLTGVAPGQISSYPQLYAAGIPCFTQGQRIQTHRGQVRVEQIRCGDRVQTRDNGLQQVVWVGQRRLSAQDLVTSPKFRPVRVAATEMLGNTRPFLVSPHHRLLMNIKPNSYQTPLGQGFVSARKLAKALPNVAQEVCPSAGVTYVHLMTERHEIIYADGVASETFWPGPEAIRALSPEDFAALLRTVPRLRVLQVLRGASGRAYAERHYGPLCRPELKTSDLARAFATSSAPNKTVYFL